MNTTENLRFSNGKLQFFDEHVDMEVYLREEAEMCVFTYVFTVGTLTGKYLPWLESSMRLAKDSHRWNISLSNTGHIVDHLKSTTTWPAPSDTNSSSHSTT